MALAWWLDGKVTAVIGTHTHVQTNDARVLPGGTAALSDAGMTGPHASVIGVQVDLAVKRMRTGPAGPLRDGERGRPHRGRARRVRRRRPRTSCTTVRVHWDSRVPHPELHAEQAYVDHAYDCLEQMRLGLERVGEAVDAPEYQAVLFEAWARRRLATFEDADRGLCFGRLDLDGVRTPLYVGRRWVHEDDTPLVVNWQAPAARPFYTATVADPLGVTLRRRFRVDGRQLLELYDEPLDGSAGDVVHGVADILLEELERSRDEHMRDIVATIQTDQFKLITREPRGVLVIQGGPGTGKTAVGLHRASWLLYTYRRELERSGVLVVGPNPVFMDYISHVLPMLGEERVEQRSIDELGTGARASRRDTAEIARRKGAVGDGRGAGGARCATSLRRRISCTGSGSTARSSTSSRTTSPS